jgi:hypothetical protein
MLFHPEDAALENLQEIRRSQHREIMALKGNIETLRRSLTEGQDSEKMTATQTSIAVSGGWNWPTNSDSYVSLAAELDRSSE